MGTSTTGDIVTDANIGVGVNTAADAAACNAATSIFCVSINNIGTTEEVCKTFEIQ